jgi:hypothetical protein
VQPPELGTEKMARAKYAVINVKAKEAWNGLSGTLQKRKSF